RHPATAQREKATSRNCRRPRLRGESAPATQPRTGAMGRRRSAMTDYHARPAHVTGEVNEADLIDQTIPAVPADDDHVLPSHIPADVDPADAADQALPAPDPADGFDDYPDGN